MRIDLPSLNPGKAMAQAAHAANLFMHRHSRNPGVKQWVEEGSGFGTTITLAITENQLINIIDFATRKHLPAGLVFDSTYPYVVDQEIYKLIATSFHTSDPLYKENNQVVLFRNELTCGYVFLVEDDPFKDELVGNLSLHP